MAMMATNSTKPGLQGPTTPAAPQQSADQLNAPWYLKGNVTQDADYQKASVLARYLSGEGGLTNSVRDYAGDLNTDVARSAMNNLLARHNQRNALQDSLNELPGMQSDEEDSLRQAANASLGAGLKKTRENYNSRGLLYSGMRQGGEQQVASGVASTLAQGMAGNRRDFANLADSRRATITQLGLGSEQQALDRANQILETTMKNSVARNQALQQLGGGVGAAAGYLANRPSTDNPNTPSTGGYSSSYKDDGTRGHQYATP